MGTTRRISPWYRVTFGPCLPQRKFRVKTRPMYNKDTTSLYSHSLGCITVVLLAFINGSDAQTEAAEGITNSIGMQLARIPAGEWMMGSADGLPDAQEDERPRHRVRITAPFYIGRYEVTQAEFEKVMGPDHQFFFTPGGAGETSVRGLDTSRFPAELVTWWDAIQFCDKLSFQPKELAARRVYHLPTEAEWEYACRAGTQTAFHFGDSLGTDRANFDGTYPFGDAPPGPFRGRTVAVGSFPANQFGLYDMHGNVWEWCADWYRRDYYGAARLEDPKGPNEGTRRVIRGGDWYSDGRDCRSAFRYADVPGGTFYALGMRVVMTYGDAKQVVRETMSAPAAVNMLDARVEEKPLPSGRGEDWPRWRGPRGNGTWRGPQLEEQWPERGLRRLWRRPIGGGYGGIAVIHGQVYVMDRQQEPDEVERVLALDADSGKVLWEHAYAVDYSNVEYGNGPRVTPTVADGQVYTLGATGQMCCLNANNGQVIWQQDFVQQFQAHIPLWGVSASPVLFENLVIAHAGGQPEGCLVALDRTTGQRVWNCLPDPAGYATPILIQSVGQPQLVSWTPTHVRGVDPRDGGSLWSVPFVVENGTSVSTPIYQEGIVLVSGYYSGTIAIQLGPDRTDAEVIWEDRRNLRGVMSQALYQNDHGYLLDRRHGLTCFELATGQKIWDDNNRITPKGRNPQATMVWLGDEDRAIILNSAGELILARLNSTGYHEQSRASIIGETWAHPAYAGRRVYARSDSEVVCFSLTK